MSPSFRTTDDENFVEQGDPPTNVRQLVWQGLPGVYIAAAAGGLYKTVDYGATWGILRPNAEFATTWPGAASGYQVSMAIGPRECPEELEFDLFIPGVGYNISTNTWTLFGNTDDENIYQEASASGGGLRAYISGLTSPDFDNFNEIWVQRGILPWSRKIVTGSTEIWNLAIAGDGSVMFAIGSDGSDYAIFRSTNDGDTWTKVKVVPANPHAQVQFFDGICVNEDGTKIFTGVTNWVTGSTTPDGDGEFWSLISTDGGDNWTYAEITPLDKCNCLLGIIACTWHPSGRLSVLVHTDQGVSNPDQIAVSDDNGVSWNKTFDAAVTGSQQAQHAAVDGTRIVYSDGDTLIESNDDGDTWAQNASPVTGGDDLASQAIVGGVLYVISRSVNHFYADSTQKTTPAAPNNPNMLSVY